MVAVKSPHGWGNQWQRVGIGTHSARVGRWQAAIAISRNVQAAGMVAKSGGMAVETAAQANEPVVQRCGGRTQEQQV